MADPSSSSSSDVPREAAIQHWERREGRYICHEHHSIPSEDAACLKDFASKQALEAHRSRAGCEPAKLPSDRLVSRLQGLTPEAVKRVKQRSNRVAVSKYRCTPEGERAVFRARHIAKYRVLALSAVPTAPEPEAPEYVRPPISWLLADAQFNPDEVKQKFASGEIRLSHPSWSLRFHPDKVQVSQVLIWIRPNLSGRRP